MTTTTRALAPLEDGWTVECGIGETQFGYFNCDDMPSGQRLSEAQLYNDNIGKGEHIDMSRIIGEMCASGLYIPGPCDKDKLTQLVKLIRYYHSDPDLVEIVDLLVCIPYEVDMLCNLMGFLQFINTCATHGTALSHKLLVDVTAFEKFACKYPPAFGWVCEFTEFAYVRACSYFECEYKDIYFSLFAFSKWCNDEINALVEADTCSGADMTDAAGADMTDAEKCIQIVRMCLEKDIKDERVHSSIQNCIRQLTVIQHNAIKTISDEKDARKRALERQSRERATQMFLSNSEERVRQYWASFIGK
jgi:hypothetical protein